jgi:hypothetical protein
MHDRKEQQSKVRKDRKLRENARAVLIPAVLL